MKVIGHRGAKGLAPENTLDSLQKALEHLVDEIEFDVRVTKDGVVILSHDDDVHDAAGNTLYVSRTSYDELKQHKPNLTKLTEVFDALPKNIPLIVEVKEGQPTGPIVAAVQTGLDGGRQPESMWLASFDQKVLRELHHALPDVPKLINEGWSGLRGRWRAKQVDTKRISMDQRWLWWGFLASMQRSGYRISPYTMNNPKKMKRWEKYLYGVITDYPNRFEP